MGASLLCRDPRGIGFIEFGCEEDAEDARDAFDRKMIDGREVGAAVEHL